MSPTLEAGQIVVSVKTNQLKTGEVVAFWQGNKLLVKRVIAGPGQWVDIDMDGNVTVDGKELTEDYLDVKALGNCDVELPHQVEESRWFLMGDNRDVSVDSRSAAIGDVSKDQIEGKIVFRIWPLNRIWKYAIKNLETINLVKMVSKGRTDKGIRQQIRNQKKKAGVMQSKLENRVFQKT